MADAEHAGTTKTGCGHSHAGHDHDHAHPGAKVVDPVCGMTVDPATSKHRFDYRGETYHFCSAGCRTKFAADPETCLDKSKPKAPAPEGAIYTCPMHPEIRQVGPGSCPICGMALEPEVASLDAPPNPELADMTRRFWIGLVLSIAGGRAGDGRASGRRSRLGRPDAVELDPVRVRHARRALGGLALLRARLAIAADAQSQHVHPDRDGHRRRLRLQPDRHRRARQSSRRPSAAMAARLRSISKPPPSSPCSCCSARCSSCAPARRPPAPSRRCCELAPKTARRIGDDGADHEVADRQPAGRRQSARPARRKGAGRRRHSRRPLLARRIDGDRRIDAGHQGGRRQGDRRHAQPVRRLRDARRQGRPRHAAVADRQDGRGGAALARADPAAGRSGVRLVRAGRDRRGADRLRRLGLVRAGAAHGVRPGRRRQRADHRLPLRARPRHADVDHGRRRARRAGRRADQECRSAGAHGKGRHAGGRQDRHADRRQAEGGRDRCRRTGFDETEILRLAASVERASEHPLADAIVRCGEGTQISKLEQGRGIQLADRQRRHRQGRRQDRAARQCRTSSHRSASTPDRCTSRASACAATAPPSSISRSTAGWPGCSPSPIRSRHRRRMR